MTPERLQQTLLELAKRKQLGHFYVLQGRGTEGDQQVKWVLEFIRHYWQTVEKRTKLPTDLKSDADLLWMIPWDEKEQERRDYMKDDLQALTTFLSYRGLQSQRRFVVMEDVHRIGGVVANKLLKTLEEPEGEVTIFWLNPSGAKLLQTLTSRAQHLALSWHARARETDLITQFQTRLNAEGYPLAVFLEEAKREGDLWLEQLLNYEIQHEGPATLKQELLLLVASWQKADTFNQSMPPRLQWIHTYLTERFRAGR